MMASGDRVDIDQFSRQAASIADRLEGLWSGGDSLRAERLGAVAGEDRERVFEDVLNQIYSDAAARSDGSLGSKEDIRAAALEARAALQTPSVRTSLCRALGPLANKSSRELTTELAKACLPLALTGQLAVPASPLVWGLLGFTVAWVGANWLCHDQVAGDRGQGTGGGGT